MDTLSEAKKIREKYEKALMRKKGVVGCGIGYKLTGGEKTDQVCIVCYVTRKIPAEQLSEADLIPAVIEGIPTDVVESGGLRAL
jgi:hypothetical protein